MTIADIPSLVLFLLPLLSLLVIVVGGSGNGIGVSEAIIYWLGERRARLGVLLAVSAGAMLVGVRFFPPLAPFELDAGTGRPTARTEPKCVIPGEPVKLFLDERFESLLGLWMTSGFSADIVLDEEDPALTRRFPRFERDENLDLRKRQPLLELESIPSERGWDLTKDHLTGPGVPSKFTIEELVFHPWIQFRVPNDESLRGTELQLDVSMSVTVPRQVRATRSYSNVSMQVREMPLLYVATRREEARFEASLAVLERRKAIKLCSQIIGGVLALCALVVGLR